MCHCGLLPPLLLTPILLLLVVFGVVDSFVVPPTFTTRAQPVQPLETVTATSMLSLSSSRCSSSSLLLAASRPVAHHCCASRALRWVAVPLTPLHFLSGQHCSSRRNLTGVFANTTNHPHGSRIVTSRYVRVPGLQARNGSNSSPLPSPPPPHHHHPSPSPSPPSRQDTIFALATGNSGPAGVAVVRISGTGARGVLEALTAGPPPKNPEVPHDNGAGGNAGHSTGSNLALASREKGGSLPAPRRAVVRHLYDPATRELLDEALVLWMPGPRSFTGEDTVELHTHGSRAVINGVLDALAGLSRYGVRMAERGEFTRRAYGNGRMDLTGVEGLADLLAADTAAQRKQALKQMGGALRDMYEAWRMELMACLAHAEAVIDFGDDEEDVGGDAAFAAIQPRVSALAAEIDAHLRDGGRGEIVRSGVRVAIVGPPNAGKSSLLNLLAARPAAIVSPVAGTTRDVVEVQMDIAGLPVTLSDTAGLREATEDEIEKEGMRRARGAVDSAHLAIFVVDSTNARGAGELLKQLREEAAAAALVEDERWTTEGGDRWGGISGGESSRSVGGALDNVIIVANKADLAVDLPPPPPHRQQPQQPDADAIALQALAAAAATAEYPSSEIVENQGKEEGRRRQSLWRVSCKTKEGLDVFMGHLEAEVRSRFQGAEDDESPLITRRRHRQHVESCLSALRASQRANLPLDLAAEELRISNRELGRITGAVGVEELLDVIFRDFCIGK